VLKDEFKRRKDVSLNKICRIVDNLSEKDTMKGVNDLEKTTEFIL
jgi:hypothetical protein